MISCSARWPLPERAAGPLPPERASASPVATPPGPPWLLHWNPPARVARSRAPSGAAPCRHAPSLPKAASRRRSRSARRRLSARACSSAARCSCTVFSNRSSSARQGPWAWPCSALAGAAARTNPNAAQIAVPASLLMLVPPIRQAPRRGLQHAPCQAGGQANAAKNHTRTRTPRTRANEFVHAGAAPLPANEGSATTGPAEIAASRSQAACLDGIRQMRHRVAARQIAGGSGLHAPAMGKRRSSRGG